MNERLTQAIDAVFSDVLNLRREIHAYPELGYQEKETTARLHAFLSAHSVPVQVFDDFTGAVANIETGAAHTVGFRGDIDAMPIQEKTGSAFTSQNPGVMHACGHDAHAAIAAGVAVILHKVKDILPCNARILFQPAEECSPVGGAKKFIEKGLLQGLDCIMGLHVWPTVPEGEVGVRAGHLMAASDKMTLTITGKKSHAGEPHKGIDAIGIGVEIVSALKKLISQETDPFEPAVLSIGEFNSSGRYNVICDTVSIAGTLRTYAPETRERLHKRIFEITQSLAKAAGGSCETHVAKGYDSVYNDPEFTRAFVQSASQTLGTKAVNADVPRTMVGEDFSFFGTVTPAFYFFLGAGCQSTLHSDTFIVSEEAIRTALKVACEFFLSDSLQQALQQRTSN